ncbi:MAG: hypothetical protein U1F56_23395 [Rubrivivax sp.]
MASPTSAPTAGSAREAGPAPALAFHFAQIHRAAPSLTDALREQALRSRWWLAADAVLVGYGLLQGGPAWVAAGLVAAAAPFALTATSHAQSDRYQRLLRHHATGNWEGVRVCAQELQRYAARRPELAFDIELRLAGIQARDEGLAAALARLESWRARWVRRPGYFDGRIAAVHLMAGDIAGHVAAMQRACDADPQQPVRQVDLALAHARFGDIDRAAALLDALDLRQLPAPGPGYVAWAYGLVALRRDAAPEARARLAAAVDGLSALADQPAGWPTLAACVCDHAVAMFQCGYEAAARALVAEVWPVLEMHATVPLLRMLEADGLVPPKP